MTSDSPTSHVRDLVAQLIHDDPDMAVVLIQFSALTDGSTPVGAALRLDALLYAYEFTPQCREGLNALMSVAA